MIEGISTVWVPVTDMERALDFYRDTLGLDVEQQEDDWSVVVAGAVRVGLNGRESEVPHGEGGAVIAFGVSEEIEDAVQSLAAEGVVVSEVTDHDWGKVATFHDPDGNELQLYEPAEE